MKSANTLTIDLIRVSNNTKWLIGQDITVYWKVELLILMASKEWGIFLKVTSAK